VTSSRSEVNRGRQALGGSFRDPELALNHRAALFFANGEVIFAAVVVIKAAVFWLMSPTEVRS
jgi:hypothetical protein